jgi:segregation and condensation protein A
MQYKVNIEKFEGPLDLLLQLIEKEELDITEVSLSKITDQYIKHLKELEEINPAELADFLVIAARLLYIKSKTLLPSLYIDEEDEGTDLEQQLKIYKEYWEAAKKIQKMISKKKFIFFREKLLTTDVPAFNPPKSLTKEKMAKIFRQVLKDIEPPIILKEEKIIKKINIEQKIEQIKKMIFDRAVMSFGTLLEGAKNKTEVIVSFLALLELVKQKTIRVDQEDLFNEILIKKV